MLLQLVENVFPVFSKRMFAYQQNDFDRFTESKIKKKMGNGRQKSKNIIKDLISNSVFPIHLFQKRSFKNIKP